MSRGFGRIERAIIEALDNYAYGATGPKLADLVAGARDSPSVRRALRRLEAKGVIARLPKRHGRSIIWALTKKIKDEARRKRRRERKYEARQEYEESQKARQRLQDRARDTARLERLLGMLGSAHEGELLNAARLVEKERRRLGKTWEEILGATPTD